MADIFLKTDAVNLLKNKHIIFFGDSNIRGQYKDLIWLLNNNLLISQESLRAKLVDSFVGDKLLKKGNLDHGREFEEERSYEKNGIHVEFFFITKCYTKLIVDLMEDIHLGIRSAPDVIVMNSTLWDVSRWGPNGVTLFKNNLVQLAKLFKSSLPMSTLVIWTTALPISSSIRSGLLLKQIEFLQHTLRFDVMEANLFAREIMVNHGYDVLDNHFHTRMQIHRRVSDGVHFYPKAVRLLTNLLLTHIGLSWGQPLPNRVRSLLLDKAKILNCQDQVNNNQLKTPLLKTPSPFSCRKKQGPKRQQNKKRGNDVLRNANRQPQLPNPWQDNVQFPPWHLDEELLAEHRIEEYFWNDTNLSYREWVNSPHGCQPYPWLQHHSRYAPY